ncbi:MAG: sugar ABC transporter permease, partial [Lachnospiraceae bacterium]|nr:sugar ABC transporter permease [Lachnospiraceae bacterium]
MTNMNVYHWTNYEYIGLSNYKDALLVFDNGFLRSLGMTVVWTVVSMVLQLVIAYVLACLLNVKGLRLKNFYKTLLIFPWAMPGYVSILLWKTGMFNSQFGLLN